MLPTINIWLVYLGTIALFLLAVEGGYRVGRRYRRPQGVEDSTEIGATQAGLLGLLGLLLAFTFSMASSRFEQRRQLILEEANAIGTAYLRADFLPEPQRSEVRSLFRAYVALRLDGLGGKGVQEAVARSEELHGRLWSAAVRAAERTPTVTAGLFVQALNDVIDVHSKRLEMGLRNRLPPTIMFTVYAVALLALAVTGIGGGLRETRSRIATVVLVMAVATVVLLIVDLDRPREGLLQVNDQILLDLRRSMAAPSP